MAKRYMTTKRLNFMCVGGLYAISAKARAGSSLISVFLTDFKVNTRVIVDMETKKVLANQYDIKLEDKDIATILGKFEAANKVADAKKVVESLSAGTISAKDDPLGFNDGTCYVV